MVCLGRCSVTDELLWTLWMARLPPQIQFVITTSADRLTNQAKMTNKIMEIDQPRTYAVAATSTLHEITSTIKQLAEEVAELRTAVKDSRRPRRSRS